MTIEVAILSPIGILRKGFAASKVPLESALDLVAEAALSLILRLGLREAFLTALEVVLGE